MLQYQTVSPNLLSLLQQLMNLPSIQQFRLVGGTGLALQLGHRQSVDIDLFSEHDFNKEKLQEILTNEFGSFVLNWKSMNGFTSSINEVKVDFFNWNIPFIMPPVIDGKIVLMDKKEIGSMKLEAITSRKDKKDFFDIMFLLNELSLKELITVFRTKYPYINHKFALESLMAIDYADETADPILLKPLSWTEAKQQIVSSVENYFTEQKNELTKKQEERLRKAEELLKNKKPKP